jgi:hypothetical protein
VQPLSCRLAHFTRCSDDEMDLMATLTLTHPTPVWSNAMMAANSLPMLLPPSHARVSIRGDSLLVHQANGLSQCDLGMLNSCNVRQPSGHAPQRLMVQSSMPQTDEQKERPNWPWPAQPSVKCRPVAHKHSAHMLGGCQLQCPTACLSELCCVTIIKLAGCRLQAPCLR